MKLQDIRNVAVLGAGIMGHGIAQVFAGGNFSVRLMDVDPGTLNKALDRIKQNLDLFLKKGLTTEKSAQATLSRIMTTTDLGEAVADAQFFVEAITENIDLKKDTFRKVDALCPHEIIMASNTSTIKIADIASATTRPENVIGTHWMLTPHIRPLVEIIPGEKTSLETRELTKALIISLGKVPIVADDMPGFIINRLQVGVFSQALKLLEQGISKEDIDRAWTHHLGLRYCLMGPIQAMDSMGLDTLYLACLYLAAVYNDPGLNPPNVVKEKFEAGEFGYKTGKGFYDYTGKSIDEIVAKQNEELINLMKTLDIKIC